MHARWRIPLLLAFAGPFGATTGGALAAGCSSSEGGVVPKLDGGDLDDASVVDGGADADSTADGRADAAAVADGGADADFAADGDADAMAGPCVETLDGVQSTWGVRCPVTLGDSVDAGLPCDSALSVSTSTCGGLRVIGYSWGTHTQACWYPADGGALVAATVQDDVPSFCAHTSYTISAGSAREVVDTGGTTTWSVSGQTCVMSSLTSIDCTRDAGAD